MKLCFVIYRYFPYGGQQRDFMRIATTCMQRGHRINVYALRWQGAIPADMEVTLVPVRSANRLKRYQRFNSWLAQTLAEEQADLVVGFDKMPRLDVYFAADSCFAEKARNQRGIYYRFTPRYRHFLACEHAVFGTGSATEALVLSPLQRDTYLRYYPGSASRMHLLPAGMAEDRKVEHRDLQLRQSLRDEFGVSDTGILLLQIGSGFRIKGVDRALLAIASLPQQWQTRIRYLLIGQDKPNRFLRLARKLGLTERVMVLPGRDDIPRFLAGADLLLHPAYQESAGYVLLEAAIAGLPVLTTASCGYAFHIEQAGAGEICTEPFQQRELNERLLSMLHNLASADWAANGLAYGNNPALFQLSERVTNLLEQFGAAKS